MQVLVEGSQSGFWQSPSTAFVVDYNNKRIKRKARKPKMSSQEHYDEAIAINIGFCKFLYDWTPSICRIFQNDRLIEGVIAETGVGAGAGSSAKPLPDPSRIWCYEKADTFLREIISQAENLNSVKEAVWQVLYTVCCISSLHYIHNDLHTGNIGRGQETGSPITICVADGSAAKPLYVSFSNRWFLIDFDQSLYEPPKGSDAAQNSLRLRKEETANFLFKLRVMEDEEYDMHSDIQTWIDELWEFLGLPSKEDSCWDRDVKWGFDETKAKRLRKMVDPQIRIVQALTKTKLFDSGTITWTHETPVDMSAVFPRKTSWLKEASSFQDFTNPAMKKVVDVMKVHADLMVTSEPITTITQACVAVAFAKQVMNNANRNAPVEIRNYCPFIDAHIPLLVSEASSGTINPEAISSANMNTNFMDLATVPAFTVGSLSHGVYFPLPAIFALLHMIVANHTNVADATEMILTHIVLKSGSYQEFVSGEKERQAAGDIPYPSVALHVLRGIATLAKRTVFPWKEMFGMSEFDPRGYVIISEDSSPIRIPDIRDGLWRLSLP